MRGTGLVRIHSFLTSLHSFLDVNHMPHVPRQWGWVSERMMENDKSHPDGWLPKGGICAGSDRSDRIRTRDLRFWRPPLYQLSYTPSPSEAAAGTPWGYFVSRCWVCLRQRGQYFRSSRRAVVFFLFLLVA